MRQVRRGVCGRLAGLALAALAGTVFLVATAVPASAHPTLVTTQPAAGYATSQSPDAIVLVFDERVRVGRGGISLEGQARGDIETAPAKLLDDGTTIRLRLREPLPDGQYTVRWQAVGDDGHVVEGAFGFGIGTRAPTAAAPSTQTAGLPAASVLRWLVLAGLAVALGGLAGERMVRDRVSRAPEQQRITPPRPPTVAGCVLGAVGAFGLAIHQLGGGSLRDGLADLDPAGLLESVPGVLVAVQLAAFILAGLAAAARARPLAVVALLAVVVAESLLSHARGEAQGWGSVTVGVHLLAATVWVGALIQVVRAAVRWRGAPGQVRALFLWYAMVAAVLYGVVVVTGTVAAVLMLPSPGALIDSGYGLVLLAKLGLVVIASALALTGRRRLRKRRRRDAEDLPTGRYVHGERVALVGVLAVTALLSSMAPPADPAEQSGFPPTVTEPAIRLGSLAGQITVGIVASEGSLIVRPRVPESDPTDAGDYTITGFVAGPRGGRQPLDLRSCGAGCFTSPARRRTGDNRVEITIDEAEWPGGTVRFRVPWPPKERQELFDTMLATMKKQPVVVLTERVTSDTSKPISPPSRFRQSGAELIELEPYRSGVVGTVVELGRDGRNVEIAFGIPAEDYYIQMTVAPDGRLVTERVTTPNHILYHIFTYPDPG